MYPAFSDHIAAMNTVYELPSVGTEDSQICGRLAQFDSILTEECIELKEVYAEFALGTGNNTSADILRARTGLADFLGDIIVYCASEAKRWNIPLDEVLAVIMSSNFSKLDVDGKPVKDERGKFLKGPNYWKPEPLISALLAGNFKLDMRGFNQPNEIQDLNKGGMRDLPPAITLESVPQNHQSDSDSPTAESHP